VERYAGGYRFHRSSLPSSLFPATSTDAVPLVRSHNEIKDIEYRVNRGERSGQTHERVLSERLSSMMGWTNNGNSRQDMEKVPPSLSLGFKPCSYVLTSRSDDMYEKCVVDPTLWVLPSLLAPLPPEGTRKKEVARLNVSVNDSNYSVDGVDRSVNIAGTFSPSTARTTIYIESAPIVLVMLVCAILYFFDSICNRPCDAATHNLEDPFPAGSGSWTAKVYIPRDFRGSLTLRSSGEPTGIWP
jgi:hypothetical protein